jgi:hypothetical protein
VKSDPGPTKDCIAIGREIGISEMILIVGQKNRHALPSCTSCRERKIMMEVKLNIRTCLIILNSVYDMRPIIYYPGIHSAKQQSYEKCHS